MSETMKLYVNILASSTVWVVRRTAGGYMAITKEGHVIREGKYKYGLANTVRAMIRSGELIGSKSVAIEIEPAKRRRL